MKVFVYYNLHKKMWSIKAMEGTNKGKVIGHSQYIWLSDVTPKVSQAGRNRVLREKCKNVHAGLVGQLMKYGKESDELGKAVSYNPYFEDHFYYIEDKREFVGCELAYLENKKVYDMRKQNA